MYIPELPHLYYFSVGFPNLFNLVKIKVKKKVGPFRYTVSEVVIDIDAFEDNDEALEFGLTEAKERFEYDNENQMKRIQWNAKYAGNYNEPRNT